MKEQHTKGGALISQIHQISDRVWNALLRSEGLEDMSGARGRVFFALWNKDGVPIRTLCEKTSLDKSTLTGILSRMERDGYITREADTIDHRTVLIFRTGKDNFFTDKVPDISRKMNALFYKGFSSDEITLLDNMLERLLQNCKDAEL